MGSKCIFCEIINNRLLQIEQKVFADKDFMVLLSHRPLTKGHTLIIPRDHYSQLQQMPDEIQSSIFKNAIRLGDLIKDIFDAKAYVLRVNDNLYKVEKGSEHVGHIHMHVIPRFKAKEITRDVPDQLPASKLASMRDKIIKGGEDFWKEIKEIEFFHSFRKE